MLSLNIFKLIPNCGSNYLKNGSLGNKKSEPNLEFENNRLALIEPVRKC